MSTLLPCAIIVIVSSLIPGAVRVNGQTSSCSADEVLSDTCIFRLDGECDIRLGIPFCDVGSDCYDCDPCLAFADTCSSCTSQSNCGWCRTGSGIEFCLSLGFMEAMPTLCSADGGSEWNVGSCAAGTTPTVIVPSPPSATPPTTTVLRPTRPTPAIGSYQCDYAADTCRFIFDGECDAGTAFCPNANSDCFDCDPCQALRFEGCAGCTAAGCVWCSSDAICLSSVSNVIVPTTVSCTASDFVDTCTAMESNDDDRFSDPLRESQSWVFDQINIKAAWDLGYTGKGVGIRFNDDGVDNLHPEFAGRFVTTSSCQLFRPVSADEKHGHGTAVASLAVGSGTDGGCGVGMAPGASLSSCRVVLTDLGEDITPENENDAFLYQKMYGMDISQNSYGSSICSSLGGSDDVRRRRTMFVRNLQNSTVCPFSSPTVCASCSTVDWSNPKTGTSCEKTITEYCTNQLRYQADASSCSSFLDLFVTCEYNGLDPGTSVALELGIQQGRDGKGIIYVYASGNDYDKGADTNFEGTLVSRYTISVGATGRDGLQALYSTGGAGLFVSAPGGDLDDYANHLAAAAGGGCRSISPGTSFSSPLVSGVIALMLEANPDLTWRDVKGILATTSRRLDGNDKSWIVNGAGLHHSYLYGFGVVDAGAAVQAAKDWQLYSAERQIMADSGTVALAIPDFPADAVTSRITVTNTDFIVESVNVYLSLIHASRGHLDIVLVSPNGTESLLHPGPRPENSQTEEKWKLLTVRAWGEMAKGDWSLRLIDRKAGDVAGCVDRADWELTILDVDLSCGSLEQLDVCRDGGKGDQFNFIFDSSVTLADPELADANGVTPDVACCACGGGVVATTVVNVLQSWQLVLYGRTVGDTVPGRTTITTTAVPGPSPQMTVPLLPTAVQPGGGFGATAPMPTGNGLVLSAGVANAGVGIRPLMGLLMLFLFVVGL